MVKFLICWIKDHPMKTYGTVEIELHAYLTSALDEDEYNLSWNNKMDHWMHVIAIVKVVPVFN
jgi:hypothetical protein